MASGVFFTSALVAGYIFLLEIEMKSRKDLIEENIELEQIAMKFKKGLHLAKKFIDSHAADPDLTVEMVKAYSDYNEFIDSRGLREI